MNYFSRRAQSKLALIAGVLCLTFTTVMADGPIVQTTPPTRQLLRATDAATARAPMGMGIVTNGLAQTNVTLLDSAYTGGSVSNATVIGDTVSNASATGGTYTAGAFSGHGYGLSNTIASAISLNQPVYLQSGFDNFTNVNGAMFIGFSFDGKKFVYINGGKSVWNGLPNPYGFPGFVPDIMIWTNGLAYMAYCSGPGGIGQQTNIFIGVSTNLLDWHYLTTVTNNLPANPSNPTVNDVFYTSKWFIDHDGTVGLTGTYTTNHGGNYDPYLVKAQNASLTRWGSFLAPTTIYGDNLRPSSHDIDDWMPLWTGSNYVALVSSLGDYGMIFTNFGSNVLMNWVYAGELETTAGGLLRGEGFNEAQLPDETWNTYYDDGPGDALVGFTRYINSPAMIPTIGSPPGGPVSDFSIPYCPGRTVPIRHGQVWLCTNLPPAMMPALISGLDQEGLNWNLNPSNSPSLYIYRTPGTGRLVMTNSPTGNLRPTSSAYYNPRL